MTVDEYEEGEPDGDPIDTLEAYFEARGWTAERLGAEEIIGTVPGSWTQYELRGVWREEDRVLQFLALPDIRVPADKRADVYETIGLVNEQLWLGHFEVWSSTGMLLFRHAALLDTGSDAALSTAQARTLIEAAVDECERFYPGVPVRAVGRQDADRGDRRRADRNARRSVIDGLPAGPIWLIGCGNMAGAMLHRWLAAGLDPARVTVVRRSERPVAAGVRVLTAPPVDPGHPAIVLLGVKPQMLDQVAPWLAPLLAEGTILVSILAGVEIASIGRRFPAARAVVRAMPNTPVAIGRGVVALTAVALTEVRTGGRLRADGAARLDRVA